MPTSSLSFLEDNLGTSALEVDTQEQIRRATSIGALGHTQHGWPVVKLERNDGILALDGPIHHEMIEKFAQDPGCVVVLYGLGLGQAARNLRAAGVNIAVIYEPEAGIARHYLERGPSELRHVPIVTNAAELESIWSRVIGDRDNVNLVDTPGYDKAYPEERILLADGIAELLERNLVNEQTLRVRGRVWIEDIVKNAEHIAGVPSAHHLQGAFEGVPAFIVGAGPSLEKNVQLLKEASKKGIVFAVNSSGKALDAAHVEPQILACLESVDITHLIRDLSFIDKTARLFSLSAHPALFETGSGPLMTIYELLPHIAGPFEKLFGRPGIPVCGSVSTACFSLAYRMGCSPIVLLGQDLAYTNGRCYAAGTAYEESKVEVSEDGKSLRHEWCETMKVTNEGQALLPGQRLDTVPAWGGEGDVQTAGTFNHVRVWFDRVGSLLNRTGGPELINATEGGARLESFKEMKLADVLAGLKERKITPEDIVEQAKTRGSLVREGDVANLFRTHQLGAEAVANGAMLLTQASKAAEADWNSPDAGLVSRRLRELQYAESELKSLVARWPWVDAWAWDSVDSSLEVEESDKNIPEVLQGIRSEGRLGEAVRQAALELSQCLERKYLELKK